MISIKLTQTDTQIANIIRPLMFAKIAKYWDSRASNVVNEFAEHFVTVYYDNFYIKSLLGETTLNDGFSLQGHFGLSSNLAQTATDDILNAFVESMDIRVTHNDKSATLTLFGMPVDYEYLLALESGRYQSKRAQGSKRNQIDEIDWVSWIIFGDDNIIGPEDFAIIPAEDTHKSRSGEAIMKIAMQPRWVVPPEINAGPETNFFVTIINEAAESFKPKLARIANAL